MLRAVIELSKYILAINLVLYTLISYMCIKTEDKNRKSFILVIQDILIFINHMTGSLVLLSMRNDLKYLFFPLFQIIAVFSFLVLMRAIYPKSNRLILNHIAMLLSIGFVILTRLSFNRSVKQFTIVVLSMAIALIIPAIMKHMQFVYRCKWIYALTGIGILGAVLVTGSITNGSKLSFSVLGVSFQPSEFVKIIYVLFLAICISEAKTLKQLFVSALLAGAHVLILVASRDLGSALIFFVTYVIMLYVITAKKRYLLLGLTSGIGASYAAYFLFSHVRVRVSAWLDPWSDIEAKGYQIAQSLFAIGTGGWFGMGLDSGTPESIPYVEQDFIFSAICEEFGVIFGICVIAICVNLFWEMIQVAKCCEEDFYKFTACGLSIVYISQLFLTIGGNTKFIPLTGVTLPLISYGGSSVLSSMIMLSIVQGLYIYSDLYMTEEYPESRKWQMNAVAGFFSIVFFAMVTYITHYVHFDSTEVINNTYNTKRQEILASQTIRGDILATDGTVLATTVEKNGEESRYYPYGEVFSHVIGYDSNGKMGVEQMANIYLVSSNISLNSKLQDDLTDEKHMGNTVYTTFDPLLQQAAYDALGVYDGAVIITEPSSGKILAMVSKPDFDPNEIAQIWDSLVENKESSVLVNRATQGLYPPGSTFKLVTALAYIRQNPTSYDNYQFTCTGSFRSGEDKIHCYHGTNHGNVDFKTSFAKSCNSSFANIGLLLNKTSFAQVLDELYFNQKLPVDFPTKMSKVSLNENSTDSQVMQTVIGQGTTQITPLHLAMLTAMVANNGEMMTPYMIDHVENANKTVIKSYEPASLGQVISEEEAYTLKELMIAVVEEGTGTRLSGRSYKVAGKTGSAEYNSSSDSHAWFTGFTYDTSNPLQITVIMEDGGSGGEYAAPVVRRILDQYYGK